MKFLTESNLTGFILGVAASLLAAFIIFGCRSLYFKITNRSKYSGAWLFQILDDSGTVIQRDLLFLTHNTKTGMIEGSTDKTFPKEKTWKKRGIIGVFLLNRLLTVSYTYEPIGSMSATHSILVGDYLFEGYMLRYIMETQKIETNAIRIEKIGQRKNKRHYRERLDEKQNQERLKSVVDGLPGQ